MRGAQVDNLSASLAAMNTLQEHRGPDGQGVWMHASQRVGFAHRRLSIIGLETGAQPMRDRAGNWITYNGEIYNYIELREELGVETFETDSDTEVILAAYRRWGQSCVSRLRGMFAFAIWDEAAGQLFCVRDRFGIKPFHFTRVGDTFYFASEAKALLPFVPAIETDYEALKEYLAFQFCLAGKTLFKGISQLLPGHTLTVQAGGLAVSKYWEVYYRSRLRAHRALLRRTTARRDRRFREVSRPSRCSDWRIRQRRVRFSSRSLARPPASRRAARLYRPIRLRA